jgi:hypothetical protein
VCGTSRPVSLGRGRQGPDLVGDQGLGGDDASSCPIFEVGSTTRSASACRLLSYQNDLLAAEREFLAPSFGQVARFRHVDLWNASSFNEHVFSFLSVTLRSHQFVIIPRCSGSAWRQWRYGCNFLPLILGQLRDLRCRDESSLCLLAILRLLKRLFQILSTGFRGAVLVARRLWVGRSP